MSKINKKYSLKPIDLSVISKNMYTSDWDCSPRYKPLANVESTHDLCSFNMRRRK